MVVNKYGVIEYLVRGVNSSYGECRACVRWRRGVCEYFDATSALRPGFNSIQNIYSVYVFIKDL